MKQMKSFTLIIVCLLFTPLLAWGQSGSISSPAYNTRQSQYPGGVNPSYFPLNQNIYEWKIKDSNPVTEACRWDEPSGMWVGDCTGYSSAPGFSITVPRTIRR